MTQHFKLFNYLLSDVLSFKDMNKNNNRKISNKNIIEYQLEKGMNNFELSELMKIINVNSILRIQRLWKIIMPYLDDSEFLGILFTFYILRFWQ